MRRSRYRRSRATPQTPMENTRDVFLVDSDPSEAESSLIEHNNLGASLRKARALSTPLAAGSKSPRDEATDIEKDQILPYPNDLFESKVSYLSAALHSNPREETAGSASHHIIIDADDFVPSNLESLSPEILDISVESAYLVADGDPVKPLSRGKTPSGADDQAPHRNLAFDVSRSSKKRPATVSVAVGTRLSAQITNIVDLTSDASSAIATAPRRNITAPSPAVFHTAGPQKQGASDPRCLICLDSFSHPTSTKCGHVFCEACIKMAVNSTGKCPTCRTAVKKRQLQRLYL